MSVATLDGNGIQTTYSDSPVAKTERVVTIQDELAGVRVIATAGKKAMTIAIGSILDASYDDGVGVIALMQTKRGKTLAQQTAKALTTAHGLYGKYAKLDVSASKIQTDVADGKELKAAEEPAKFKRDKKTGLMVELPVRAIIVGKSIHQDDEKPDGYKPPTTTYLSAAQFKDFKNFFPKTGFAPLGKESARTVILLLSQYGAIDAETRIYESVRDGDCVAYTVRVDGSMATVEVETWKMAIIDGESVRATVATKNASSFGI